MPKNPPAKEAKTKASTTAKKITKPISKKAHSIRTKPRFYRTNTKTQVRNPKILRSLNTFNKINQVENLHKILIQPLSSDKNMAKMENENTLVYLVHPRANKVEIKAAFKKLYQATVRSVNTLIRPDGKKKAFIRLGPGSEALKVATKIGIL